MALCRPFAVLLVDEPFAGLDAIGQSVLAELLDEVRNQNGAVIVATHDRAKLAHFDRCVELRNGEIVSDGPAA